MGEYIQEKTSIFRKKEKVEKNQFPVISLCFGFDHEVNKKAQDDSWTGTSYFNTYPEATEPVSLDQLHQW